MSENYSDYSQGKIYLLGFEWQRYAGEIIAFSVTGLQLDTVMIYSKEIQVK